MEQSQTTLREIDESGIYDIRNISNVTEANAHLIYRTSEVIGSLDVPLKMFNRRGYDRAKKFYEDAKTILQKKPGLTPEVVIACDRTISDLEKYMGACPLGN